MKSFKLIAVIICLLVFGNTDAKSMLLSKHNFIFSDTIINPSNFIVESDTLVHFKSLNRLKDLCKKLDSDLYDFS